MANLCVFQNVVALLVYGERLCGVSKNKKKKKDTYRIVIIRKGEGIGKLAERGGGGKKGENDTSLGDFFCRHHTYKRCGIAIIISYIVAHFLLLLLLLSIWLVHKK